MKILILIKFMIPIMIINLNPNKALNKRSLNLINQIVKAK